MHHEMAGRRFFRCSGLHLGRHAACPYLLSSLGASGSDLGSGYYSDCELCAEEEAWGYVFYHNHDTEAFASGSGMAKTSGSRAGSDGEAGCGCLCAGVCLVVRRIVSADDDGSTKSGSGSRGGVAVSAIDRVAGGRGVYGSENVELATGSVGVASGHSDAAGPANESANFASYLARKTADGRKETGSYEAGEVSVKRRSCQ